MKKNREMEQVCKATYLSSLLQLFGWIILWSTLSLVAEANSVALDRASSLFPIPLEQSNSWDSDQCAVNADFDGDHQLDRASIKFARNGYDGYEIDVTLSIYPGTGTKIFWPGSEHVGLGLITCDVDQDGDQDLVLTSSTSLFPLAIWISDGAGHFQKGDHAFFVPLFSSNRQPTVQPGKNLDKQICFPRQRRDSVDLSRGASKLASLEISTLSDQPSLAPLPRRGALSLTSRGPPRIPSS